MVALALGSRLDAPGLQRPAQLSTLLCESGEGARNSLEASRITRNLVRVNYVEYGSYNPAAMLYFASFDLARFRGQLEFASSPANGADVNVSAAWCDEGFAVQVRTEPYIQALKNFRRAILNRKVVFAEGLFSNDKFGGIVLADESLLTEKDLMAIRTMHRSSEASQERELAETVAA
jgi:hypothetical protein